MKKELLRIVITKKISGLQDITLFRFARYYSERVKNEMLTAEQREKWKDFIGKEIPEKELTILQKDYVKRTAHYIPPINPKVNK